MADTGKKPAPESGAVTPTTRPEPTGNVTEESSRASYLVKTAWPHDSFDMPDDDVPMITSEGTMLTKTQLETAEKSAKLSSVELIVEEAK